MLNKTNYETPKLEQYNEWSKITAFGASGAPLPGDLDFGFDEPTTLDFTQEQ